MFPKCRVIGRVGSTAWTTLLAGSGNEGLNVSFVEEQIITIDDGLFSFEGETLTWFQFQFTGGVWGKDIPLVQPKWTILYAQIPSWLIKRCDRMGCVENNLEHITAIIPQNRQKRGVKFPLILYKTVWIMDFARRWVSDR
jgi:hypothetical protein